MRLAVSLEHSCRIRSRTLALSERSGNRAIMRQNGPIAKRFLVEQRGACAHRAKPQRKTIEVI